MRVRPMSDEEFEDFLRHTSGEFAREQVEAGA